MYQVVVDVPFKTASKHMSWYELMTQYIKFQQQEEESYDFVGSGEECVADLRRRIEKKHDSQKA